MMKSKYVLETNLLKTALKQRLDATKFDIKATPTYTSMEKNMK